MCKKPNDCAQTKTSITIYNLDGEKCFHFDLDDRGLQIECASPDGVHAVLLRFSGYKYYTQLVLWDIRRDEQIAVLAEGTKYEMRDALNQDFSNLLHACFSPDGKIVSAYHYGGYFDPNLELTLYSSDSGEKICSLNGDLLGTRAENGVQDGKIDSFMFLDNETAYWKGGAYHVFYSIPLDTVYRIPISLSADFQKRFDSSPYLGSFTPVASEDNEILLDFRFRAPDEISKLIQEDDLYVPDYKCYGGKYIVSCLTETVVPSKLFSRFHSDASAPCVSTIMAGDILSGDDPGYCNVLDSAYSDYEFLTGSSSVCFVWLKNSMYGKAPRLIRIDVDNKTMRQIGGIERYQSLCFLGSSEEHDYFVGLTNTGTELLRIDPDGVQYAVRIDAPYSSLSNSAVLNNCPGNMKLLCLYHDEFCLYELEPSAFTLYKAEHVGALCTLDSSGSFLLLADSTELSWWKDTEPSGTYQLDWSAETVGITSDGRWFSAGGDNLIVCDKNGKLLFSSDSETNLICSSVKISENGRLLSWLTQDNLYGFNETYMKCTLNSVFLDTGEKMVYRHKVHWEGDYSASDAYDVSPDGSLLAIIEHNIVETEPKELYSRELSLFSSATGEVLATSMEDERLKSQPDFFTGVHFCNSNQLLACSASTVTLYNAANLGVVSQIKSVSQYNSFPTLLPNDLLLYYGSDLEIWDISNGAILQTIPLAADQTVRVCVSSNANWLTLTSSGTALYRIRDMNKRADISSLPVEILCLTEGYMLYRAGRSVICISF